MSDFLRPFINAIKSGNIDKVRETFKADLVDKCDISKRTALHEACMFTNVDIVRFLLDNGWNIEYEDINLDRPMHHAALCGCISIVKELINRGCLLDVPNIDGFTPLNLSMTNDHRECTKILREATKSVQSGDTSMDTTETDNNGECADMLERELKTESSSNIDRNYDEFISAINRCNIDDVKRLFRLEYINKKDKYDRIALHHACVFDNTDIVRYLLDNGWDIECETNAKDRPIHIAAAWGRLLTVNELIIGGCLLDVRNLRDCTPRDLSAMNNYGDCTEILQEDVTKTDIEKVMMRAIIIIKNNKGELIGRGGYGQVYKYVDKYFTYAVKRVFVDPKNQDVVDINKEIDLYKTLLIHPRIVRYFGSTFGGGAMYVFMEFATGGSIEQFLVKHGALPHDTIARYTKQILEGLQFLHQNNIIHGDIKCANLLIDSQDNIKICDFGISRHMATISSSRSTSAISGSPYWMAPEVIANETITISADIWSLGVTVVEMLIGEHPYASLNPSQAMFKIGIARTIEYEPVNPISAELQSFLDQMLVGEPTKRADVTTLLTSKFINTVSATMNV